MSRSLTMPKLRPGEGQVAVQTPIAWIIERCGMSIEAYISLIRLGRLSYEYHNDVFDSRPTMIEKVGGRTGWEPLPPKLPAIAGRITWRAKQRHWSLDVEKCELTETTRYWSSVQNGLAQLSVTGSMIPETLRMHMVDQPLSRFVDHPALADPGIIISAVTCYATGDGCTEFKLTVPVALHADQPITQGENP